MLCSERGSSIHRPLTPQPPVIETRANTEAELLDTLARVRRLPEGTRGHAIAELTRGDGSCLNLGYTGDLAVVVWTDSLGTSYHSGSYRSGSMQDRGEVVVFDYFGSETEIPTSCCIPASDATAAAVTTSVTALQTANASYLNRTDRPMFQH